MFHFDSTLRRLTINLLFQLSTSPSKQEQLSNKGGRRLWRRQRRQAPQSYPRAVDLPTSLPPLKQSHQRLPTFPPTTPRRCAATLTLKGRQLLNHETGRHPPSQDRLRSPSTMLRSTGKMPEAVEVRSSSFVLSGALQRWASVKQSVFAGPKQTT